MEEQNSSKSALLRIGLMQPLFEVFVYIDYAISVGMNKWGIL